MADADPAPKNPAWIVFGAIAIFLALIGSGAVYFLWPRGDRLGAIDLRSETPTLSIEVGAGDKLNFRIERVVVGTIGGGYPDSSRSRSNRVQEELQASRISVTSIAVDGTSKASTECGAFAGKATTGSSDSDSVTSSGLPLDCAIVVEKGGPHTVSVKVAWVPKDVREAILEVRREKADK